VALDLGEVALVDCKVVRFLALCEGSGVKLKSAPDYLRSGSAKSERKSMRRGTEGSDERRVRRKRAIA